MIRLFDSFSTIVRLPRVWADVTVELSQGSTWDNPVALMIMSSSGGRSHPLIVIVWQSSRGPDGGEVGMMPFLRLFASPSLVLSVSCPLHSNWREVTVELSAGVTSVPLTVIVIASFGGEVLEYTPWSVTVLPSLGRVVCVYAVSYTHLRAHETDQYL
eukprot:131353-Amorphochlora_amoeboformis.AAC.1